MLLDLILRLYTVQNGATRSVYCRTPEALHQSIRTQNQSG